MGSLDRSSAFEYRCTKCKRCCQHKLIRVNPYESLRLARARGISTKAFLEQYVDRETSFLRLGEEGFCQFFSRETGCTVHPDRPMVCRLYPLGRHLSSEGVESFSTITPHPQSEGVYSDGDGTIADYLAQQEIEKFIAATDRLLGLFHEMFARLPENAEVVEEDIDWLDVDEVISRVGAFQPGVGVEDDFDQYCKLLATH